VHMYFVSHSMTEETISGVYVFPGSTETSVRRGGRTNHHLIAYSLSKTVDVCRSYSVLHSVVLVVLELQCSLCYLLLRSRSIS